MFRVSLGRVEGSREDDAYIGDEGRTVTEAILLSVVSMCGGRMATEASIMCDNGQISGKSEVGRYSSQTFVTGDFEVHDHSSDPSFWAFLDTSELQKRDGRLCVSAQ